MRVTMIGAGLIALTVLGACASRTGEDPWGRTNRRAFDGNYYPAKVTASKERPEQFSVAVRRFDQGLNGAKESGRYEAIKYCLGRFGNSDITWAQGPDLPDAQQQLTDRGLILTGECVGWV